MASRSYVLPDPATNTGSWKYELGDGAGQILRFLRVPAGVGQQGRLADVLGRASDEPRVRVRSWRVVVVVVVRRRTQPTSPSSDMMRVVGFRVSRNLVALVKMPVATVCDLVSLSMPSARRCRRARSPRVASPRCPARAWVPCAARCGVDRQRRGSRVPRAREPNLREKRKRLARTPQS